MTTIPYVIEQSGKGERSYDIYSRLLKDRIIMIGEEITDHLANSVVAQLLFLAADAPEKEITIFINSPGDRPVPVSPFMIRCNILSLISGLYVRGWLHHSVPCFYWRVRKGKGALCQIVKSCFINRLVGRGGKPRKLKFLPEGF